MYTKQKISIGSYSLVLMIITPEHFKKNENIVQIINQLSEDENGYVQNLTKRKLKELNNPVP